LFPYDDFGLNVGGVDQWLNGIPMLMKHHKVPGLALAIWEDGQCSRITCYGQANPKNRVNEHTLFQAGSISKTFTTWAVMNMAEEGSLDLQASVEKLIPWWSIPSSPFNNSQITIKSLLSHTGGVNISSYLGYEKQNMPDLVDSPTFNHRHGIKIIYDPNRGFYYSGGGYTLLQAIIESQTGMPFAEYMHHNLLVPLGMKDATFDNAGDFEKPLAIPYSLLNRPISPLFFVEKAATGLYASISDMSKFIGEHIANREVDAPCFLMPSSLRMMTTRVFRKVNYGLGYRLITFPDNNKLIYHRGETIGYSSVFAIFPGKRAGIAILSNSNSGHNLISIILSDWISQVLGSIDEIYIKYMDLKKRNPLMSYMKYHYLSRKQQRLIH
jgi:D-alanyl-D-alanine carboxypeptidase